MCELKGLRERCSALDACSCVQVLIKGSCERLRVCGEKVSELDACSCVEMFIKGSREK